MRVADQLNKGTESGQILCGTSLNISAQQFKYLQHGTEWFRDIHSHWGGNGQKAADDNT